MTDVREEPGPERADSAGRLPSARDTAEANGGEESDRGQGRTGGRRGKRRGRAGKPTPARTTSGAEPAAPSIEPDARDASVEIDGRSWTVRVLGRSGGGRRGVSPLLLLGFWAPGASEGAHVREVLTVGRGLANLSESDLRAAHARSETVDTGVEGGGFFADLGERGRRG